MLTDVARVDAERSASAALRNDVRWMMLFGGCPFMRMYRHNS
jgi:hypothetical protein